MRRAAKASAIRTCLTLLAAALFAWGALAQPGDPKPPPGRDPGGVAVAFVGPGVDYARAEIAGRLARDGEGDLIGWDTVDDDALPFEPAMAAAAPSRQAVNGTALASLLLSEAGGARLIPLRAAVAEPASLAKAIAFVARTPGRIVLVMGADGAPDPALLAQAAGRFPQLLFIVPTDGASAAREQPEPGNLLRVSAAPPQQSPAGGVVVEGNEVVDNTDAAVAAVRVAALAARLLAVEPALGSTQLKQRIVSLESADRQLR